MGGWTRTDRPGVRMRQMTISPSRKKTADEKDACVSSEKVDSIVSCEAWKCRKPLHARTLKTSEFFLYLHSDCWDDGCVLRVSEGKLLDDLLTSLYLLVNKEAVVTHNTYAFARDVPLKTGGYAGKENITYQNLVFEFVHFGRLSKESPNQSRQSHLEPISVQPSISGQNRKSPEKTLSRKRSSLDKVGSVSVQRRTSVDKVGSVSGHRRTSVDKTGSVSVQRRTSVNKVGSVPGHRRTSLETTEGVSTRNRAKGKRLSVVPQKIVTSNRLGLSRSDSRLSETESVFPLARSRGSMVYVTTARPNLGETFSSDTEIDTEEQLALTEARARKNARELKKRIKGRRLSVKQEPVIDEEECKVNGKELVLLDSPSVEHRPKTVRFLLKEKKQQLFERRQDEQDFIQEIEEAKEVIRQRQPTFPPVLQTTEKLPHLWYHTGLPDKLPSFEEMVKIMKNRDPRFQNIVDRHARKVVHQYTHHARKQEPLDVYLKRCKSPVVSHTEVASIPEDDAGGVVHGITDSIPCKEHYLQHTGSGNKAGVSSARPTPAQTPKGKKRKSPVHAKSGSREAGTHKHHRKIYPKLPSWNLPVINLIKPSRTRIQFEDFVSPKRDESAAGTDSQGGVEKVSAAGTDSQGGVEKVSRVKTNKKVRIFTPRLFPKAPICLDDDSGSEDEEYIAQSEIDAETKFDTRKLNFRYSFERLYEKRRRSKLERFEEHIADQEVTLGKAMSVIDRTRSVGKETKRKRAQTLPDLTPGLKGFKGLKQGPVRQIRTEQALYKSKTRDKKLDDDEEEEAVYETVIGKLRPFKFKERNHFWMTRRRSPAPDSSPDDASRAIVVDFTDDLNKALDQFVVTKEVVVSEHRLSSRTAQISLTFTRIAAFVINKEI